MKVSVAFLLQVIVLVVGAIYSHFTLFASMEDKFQKAREDDRKVYMQAFASKESVVSVKEIVLETREDVKEIRRYLVKK